MMASFVPWLPVLESLQPLLYRSDLPEMSLLDKKWLSCDVQDTITIPMMASPGDQVARM